MHTEQRKRANGTIYYSIVYWDGPKKVRLKQTEHPRFKSQEEAITWAHSKTAEYDSMKARALRRLEWKNKYYDFQEIAREYLEFSKNSQPNSWKNTEFYLYHYVLPFFLGIKDCNNPNNWSLYYDQFRDWLEVEAQTIKKPKAKLSYSSMNHCIKTLNTFSGFLIRRQKVDPSNVYKVKAFESFRINSRDAASLIAEDEFQTIYNRLKEINPLVAIFYQTAFYTGMRFNEIFGLSMASIIQGEIDDTVFSTALKEKGIHYYGYIVLEDQPKGKTIERESNGAIKRKPLKSTKKICEKNNRIIPIIDKGLFNSLVKLFKEQNEQRKFGRFGSDLKNYLLFDGLTSSSCSRSLRLAYEGLPYSYKSFHCCRHTRCTAIVGQTRDFILARYWLGHSRQETTFRYTHIYQQSSRQAKIKKQQLEYID